MHLHINSATTLVTRQRIHGAEGSLRSLACRFNLSVSTIRRWKGRDSWEDRSSRPKRIRCSIEASRGEMLLQLRCQGMSLDDIFETVMDDMPGLSRSALYRFLRRHGMGKRAPRTREPKKKFKDYEPGYLHIDTFFLPRFNGKRTYCFVAIDRATRRTHVGLSFSKCQRAGAEFLRSCLEAFEFKVAIVLTDNGGEFTNWCYKGGKARRQHAFDKVCTENGIRHRLTKIRTPKTNGLVERQNQIIKNATIRKNTYLGAEAAFQAITDWSERNNQRRKRHLRYVTPLAKSLEWYTLKPEIFNREPVLEAA